MIRIDKVQKEESEELEKSYMKKMDAASLNNA